MSKHIVILSGSPRKGGNTDSLVQAFTEGAQTQGHTVSLVHAASKKIGACKACDTCWSTGRACTFKDDFTTLEPLLEKADVLVLATPLYWFSFSAQIKALIDRLYAYDMPNKLRSLQVRQALLLACAAGTEEGVFEGLKATFKSITAYMHWENSGMLLVPGVAHKGDIQQTEALEQAKQLGMSL